MTEARDLIGLLRESHRRLTTAVAPMTEDQLRGRSYCRDWNIAQVLSHIGSGTEVFGLILDAGLSGSEAPGRDQFIPIWDGWNAMTPLDQAQQSIKANEAFLARLDSLSDEELGSINMELFGMPTDALRILSMRLSEHAIHTWDVLVMQDQDAGLARDAVEPILAAIGRTAGRSGKPEGRPMDAEITTTDPARSFHLVVADDVKLESNGNEASSSATKIRMPAEALIRLVYGRLDVGHTPATVAADGVDLDTLRGLFPGF